MPDTSPIPADVPPLPVLLRQLNKALDWKSSDLARWLKWDTAQVSRMLKVGSNHRPTNTTLEYLARRYTEAGLENVTIDLLIAARDYGGRVDATTYAIPDHWLRLVRSVQTLDPELQDKLFTRWQEELQYSLYLIFRGRRDQSDESQEN